MREISAIDAEIEATETKLASLKQERAVARLPEFSAPIMAAFAEAFHQADLNNYGGGDATVKIADGVRAHIRVQVSDEIADDYQ